MKTKEDRINIVTLGCAKNIVDSEVLLTQLRGNNIELYKEGYVLNNQENDESNRLPSIRDPAGGFSTISNNEESPMMSAKEWNGVGEPLLLKCDTGQTDGGLFLVNEQSI